VGKIPKGWSVEKLGNISNVKSGKRLPKGEKLVENKTSHPYIRIKDLKNGTINQENLLYLVKSTFEQISKYIITSNDLYISIVGTIGLVGFVPEKLDNANLTENCARLTDFTDVKKEFLYYFLNSQLGKDQIKKLTVGTTQSKLALHRIKDIEFILPSKHLIEKFSITSKNIISILQKNHSCINSITKTRDVLLPKLMSGEIRV
jgi:type I restriction enzyme, S subunit